MSDDAGKSIVCIGWGSLIWDPRGLPLRSAWENDGPMLPVEFARESSERQITLVICPGLGRVRTCWARLGVRDIERARTALGLREYSGATPRWIEVNIGYWDSASGKAYGMEADAIAEWGKAKALDGAVWTSLPCGLKGNRSTMPDANALCEHLQGLDGEARQRAETYIRNAPAQIDTPYRRLIEERLGWTKRS